MRLLFLVLALSALEGLCQNIPLQTATVGTSSVSFSVNVTNGIARALVRFTDQASFSTTWTAFGLGTVGGGMTSGGQGTDVFMCEADGRVGRYWVTQTNIVANQRRNATGTCNVSFVGGVGTKTMYFERKVNKTANNERALTYGDHNILLAKGPYTLKQHTSYEQVTVSVAAPGTTNAPSAVSTTTAPTAAGAGAIMGYSNTLDVLNKKMKIAWEIVGAKVRFALEVPGASWAAIGFQELNAPSMKGDAVIATPTLGYYTSETTVAPVMASGTYYTDGNSSVAGGTLRASFTRTLAAPLSGTVDISGPRVQLMLAYGTSPYPNQHLSSTRGELIVDLRTGGATEVAERSPAVAPKVVAIVILAILCLVGFIFTIGLSHTKPGRWFFFRRLCKDSQFLGPRTPSCFDLTMGQVTLLVAYFALITLFSRLEFGAAAELSFLRAMGWTSTLTIACASIPVSRHSVLLYFFGMSFERAILVHRIMGRTAILIVLMHFVAVLLEPQYQPFRLTQEEIPPYDINLSLGFWAFICMLVIGSTAIPIVRRKFFEVFYYAHHLFIAVWILSILHNKSLVHQLTLLVPVGLWALDRGIRFYRGRIRHRELVSATINADALRLEFKGEIATCTSVESGSYAFINVPGVSRLQWHPFSISSRAGAPNFTFHIKNMGPGTFTGALHEYFAKHEKGVKVNIDGPYGRSAVRFEEYESILLMAGGVGVTPMAAILDDLYEKCKNGQKPPKLDRVTFCWVIQAKETISWMEDLLKKIQATPSVGGATFDVQVYVTRTKEESHLHRAGRPKISEVFESAGRSKHEGQVGVLVCGPESMVMECQKQAMVVGYDFHKEIFAF